MELENMKFKESGMKIIAAGFLSLALIGNAWAGQVTGLKTFVPATPALAAEVNANFTSVGVAVNDNDTRITANAAATTTNTQVSNTNAKNITKNSNALMNNSAVHIIDANGVILAKFLQMDVYSNGLTTSQTNFRGMSNQGYLVKERFSWQPSGFNSNPSTDVIYGDAACTTPKFFLENGLYKFELKQGVVMLKDANKKTLSQYVAKNSVANVPGVTANLFRYHNTWTAQGLTTSCVSLVTSLTTWNGTVSPVPAMVSLLPNNPLVTGVPANLLFPLGLK